MNMVLKINVVDSMGQTHGMLCKMQISWKVLKKVWDK